MFKDTIKTLITNKGWLSVESLYFDNALNVMVFNTHGRIAIDKTTDILYFTGSLDSLISSSLRDRVVIYDDNDYSLMASLNVADLDTLQRAAMSLYTKHSNYKDGKDFPVPSIPKLDTDIAGRIVSDLTYLNKFNEHPDVPLIKIYTELPVYLNADELTAFFTNQAKFKTFLATYMGILPENLL